MRHGILFAIGFAVLVIAPRQGRAKDVLIVENKTSRSAELWVWPEQIGKYLRPEIFLPAKDSTDFGFLKDENYWLLLRDNQLREIPVGWVNISAELKMHPGRHLEVKEVFEEKVEAYRTWDRRWRQWIIRNHRYTTSKVVADWVDPSN